MKRVMIIYALFTAFVPMTGYSATGDVLSSFTAPGAGTTGLTFDGTYLWTVNTMGREFLQLTTSGSVVTSVAIPSEIITPVDLAYDGTDLWVTDKTSDKLFKVSTGGTVITSFDCPCTQPMGLTFDGTDLWVGSEREQLVQVTVSGTAIKSMASPVITPQGLTYANDLLWISGLVASEIHASTVYAGGSVYSFGEPDGNTQGLAFDGTNLWATGSLTDTIYELELNPIMIIPSLSYFQFILLLGIMGYVIIVHTEW